MHLWVSTPLGLIILVLIFQENSPPQSTFTAINLSSHPHQGNRQRFAFPQCWGDANTYVWCFRASHFSSNTKKREINVNRNQSHTIWQKHVRYDFTQVIFASTLPQKLYHSCALYFLLLTFEVAFFIQLLFYLILGTVVLWVLFSCMINCLWCSSFLKRFG